MANIIDVLKERGFIEAVTHEEVRQLTEKPTRVYCGFDPTADSLHLGNLIAIMGLAWFQRFGHTPVAIVGGATGMIGDPSGKTSERQLLNEKILQHNLIGIRKNLEKILNFHANSAQAIILNNFDWWKEISSIQFLREIGSFFRIGQMLSKESVKLRCQSEEGMSFTEFSYQILQGYDFLYLFENHQVMIELGGSDQWGNIIAGTDLIRKVHGRSAFGITFPLLTKSDGQKFGKSEKGAIWLSPEKVSPYEFYQYLLRSEDADVTRFMRMLTFMDMEEIRFYERRLMTQEGEPREAQKRLAQEVTELVHGKEGLHSALQVTEGFSPGSSTVLDENALENLSRDVPCFEIDLSDLINMKVIDLLVIAGLQNSKGDARKLIRNGGVYINNQKVVDESSEIQKDMVIANRFLLISTGKKNKKLIKTQVAT